ncbi:MAG TPA: trimeric intracellular cation channel family protein [Terrimicrobiaceae bacterium]|nr:trimeric intracellular cation channel family protein [Terrimicrobiaceae bacterium]
MVIYLLQLAGTAACASSGALSAGRKSLDLVGVMVISFAAAVGGGTLRDLLLDRNPVFWLADNSFLLVSIGTGLSTWVYTRRWSPPLRLLLLVDAIGLALFTISGIQIAEQAGQSALACLVMGVITGVAGGILRDVLCGEIPMTFRRSELYASASLLGGGGYLLLISGGLPAGPSAMIGATATFLLRMAALKWGWHLPVFEFKGGR